jgi:hypothetical protein
MAALKMGRRKYGFVTMTRICDGDVDCWEFVVIDFGGQSLVDFGGDTRWMCSELAFFFIQVTLKVSVPKPTSLRRLKGAAC